MTNTTRAFTLSELIVGMVVTSLVGLSAATASNVFGSRYCRSEESFESVQAARTALRRMSTAVCGSQLLLYVDANRMLLWREEGVGDGQIQKGELVVLAWSDGNLAQTSIVSSGKDSSVALKDVMDKPGDFIRDVLKDGQSTVLASRLTGLTVALNTAAPMTTLATISVSSGRGTGAVSMRIAASLRGGGRTSMVTYTGGKYYLSGS